MSESLKSRAWIAPVLAMGTATLFYDKADGHSWLIAGFTVLGLLAGWLWQRLLPDDVANRLAPGCILLVAIGVGTAIEGGYTRELFNAVAGVVCALGIGCGVVIQARYLSRD